MIISIRSTETIRHRNYNSKIERSRNDLVLIVYNESKILFMTHISEVY